MKKNLTKDDIPAALTRFSEMPDVAFVDTSMVEALIGLSRITIHRRVKSGDLPAPKKFGRSVRFNVGQLRRALST